MHSKVKQEKERKRKRMMLERKNTKRKKKRWRWMGKTEEAAKLDNVVRVSPVHARFERKE